MLFSIALAVKLSAVVAGIDGIKVTLTNDEKEPLSIITANSPFSPEPLTEDVLRVNQGGYPAQFVGHHVNWNYNALDDVTKILYPGESLTNIISVSGRYSTFTGPVTATVSFPLRLCRELSCDMPRLIESEPLELSARTYKRRKTIANPNFNFVNCDKKQTVATEAAVKGFPLLEQSAIDYLNAATEGSKIAEFFGSSSNIKKAVKTYTKSKNHVFDMTCGTIDMCGSESVYAFVYPNQPGMVYFCGQFFKTSNTGWDSRPGVLVHEVSHFKIVGDTDDIVYGRVGARELAKDSPLQTVNNADNFEYFAESVYFNLSN